MGIEWAVTLSYNSLIGGNVFAERSFHQEFCYHLNNMI